MDVPVAKAVETLILAVTGLLPPPVSPALAPDILINPVKTHPSGIGGYVGLHPAPFGEIHARWLRSGLHFPKSGVEVPNPSQGDHYG